MAKTPMSPEKRAAIGARLKAAREARKALSMPVAVLDEPEAAETDEAALERRRRLTSHLDPETAALLTDDDLIKIEAEEHAAELAEKKKQALRDVRARARQLAKVELDTIPADTLRSDEEQARINRRVQIRFDLPGGGAGHLGRNGLTVNGMLYDVGTWHTVPVHVMESLRANHYRTWFGEIQFKTLDQHKPGGSATEILAHNPPPFEIRDAAA